MMCLWDHSAPQVHKNEFPRLILFKTKSCSNPYFYIQQKVNQNRQGWKFYEISDFWSSYMFVQRLPYFDTERMDAHPHDIHEHRFCTVFQFEKFLYIQCTHSPLSSSTDSCWGL